MRTLLVALATFSLATAALGGTALAHAKYVSSNPRPGQTLQASPASVTITFTEELKQGSTGTVTDAAGTRVDSGATIDANARTNLNIALKPSLPNGVYKVNWHSISADDGDELDGSFFFGLGVAAPSTATAPSNRLVLPVLLLAASLVAATASVRAVRRRPA